MPTVTVPPNCDGPLIPDECPPPPPKDDTPDAGDPTHNWPVPDCPGGQPAEPQADADGVWWFVCPGGSNPTVAGYGGQGGNVQATLEGGPLPFTGLDVIFLFGVGLLLVLVGLTLRRRLP